MPQPPSSYAPVANPREEPSPTVDGTDSIMLDPESSNLLGRPGSEYLPAPSLMSRNSTTPSIKLVGQSSPRHGYRDSWGSGEALTAGVDGMTERRSSAREGSALANPYSNDDGLSSDEDDEQGHITPAVAAIGAGTAGGALNEKSRWADSEPAYGKKKSRKWLWVGLGAGLIVLIGLAVGLGVGLTRDHNSNTFNADIASADSSTDTATATASTASATSSATASATATSGTQGSLVALDDGTTMTYDNPHGGTWVWDESDPFNNEAQAQSWAPSLSQNWTWGTDKVFGVNVGGWLVTEPFIVPGMYEIYANGTAGTAIDEYTLSQNMGDNLTAAMTEHYETFITERDFAEMASAGINWVRIPIGFWAIETWDDEPYLERVSWTYFLKAIKWCRKYGLRINLDLHTVPGSQNGWNHSGRLGQVNFLEGAMGLANAQRALDYIRTLAQFIAQDEYSPVIQMFGFINEPNGNSIGKGAVGSFYLEAYEIIRDITGIGAGNGPMLSMHDAFLGVSNWYGYLPGADRMILDQHTYMVFQDQPTGNLTELQKKPCQWWASSTNTSSESWGPNVAGEWSAAWNDCGKWVNNVGSGSRYDGSYDGYSDKATGQCDYWNDYTLWNASTKDALNHFVLGSMDALQNFFFWTWKIGNSTESITEPNPFWHYRLGLAHGWIPSDPREAVGTCQGDGVTDNIFDGTYSSAYMTGGAGAGVIASSATTGYTWPPTSFTDVASASMSKLPQYTQTATPITMPGPTFTKPGTTETVDAGSGWYNPDADDRLAYAAIDGCSYPAEYSAVSVSVTASACGAGMTQPAKRAFEYGLEGREDVPRPTLAPHGA